MQKTPLEKIKQAVEEAKKYPRAAIEYNLELPPEVTAEDFFGVEAVFNKNVPREKGVNVIYRY